MRKSSNSKEFPAFLPTLWAAMPWISQKLRRINKEGKSCHGAGKCDGVDKESSQRKSVNCLITLRRSPGYFLFLWYCVLLIRRDDHDNQSDSSPVTPILRERRPGPGLAARRGAGDLQKTRPAGQPAAVSDLPPLRCCALPVRSRTSQIPRCKIRAQKLRRKTKIRLWG